MRSATAVVNSQAVDSAAHSAGSAADSTPPPPPPLHRASSIASALFCRPHSARESSRSPTIRRRLTQRRREDRVLRRRPLQRARDPTEQAQRRRLILVLLCIRLTPHRSRQPQQSLPRRCSCRRASDERSRSSSKISLRADLLPQRPLRISPTMHHRLHCIAGMLMNFFFLSSNASLSFQPNRSRAIVAVEFAEARMRMRKLKLLPRRSSTSVAIIGCCSKEYLHCVMLS